VIFDSELEWYRRRSGQDERCDKAVDYSLIVDVAMDGLHTRLDRDTFVAGERGHRGSITGTKDASCCIMMEKMSTQNCSRGGPSSEARDLTIRATIIGVSVGQDYLVFNFERNRYRIDQDTPPPQK